MGRCIEIGRKINKLSGDVYVNAGLRGLNCIVCNKNKLVVFDWNYSYVNELSMSHKKKKLLVFMIFLSFM